MSTDHTDLASKESSKPYIAIVVLVCGVIGGLIIVIAFIFFCKFCFKKNQPLTSAESNADKNDTFFIKPKTAKQGYQILDGSNSAVSPIPADVRTYHQQPASATLVNNNNIDEDAQAQRVKGSSEPTSTSEASEAAKARRQDIFTTCKKLQNDIEVLSVKHAKSYSPTDGRKSPRQRSNTSGYAKPTSPYANHVDMRRGRTVEERRRSCDDTYGESPTAKRHLPSLDRMSQYYRPAYSTDVSVIDEEAHMESWMTDAGLRAFKTDHILSPFPHLPQSHQTVIDKSSPPLRRPRLASQRANVDYRCEANESFESRSGDEQSFASSYMRDNGARPSFVVQASSPDRRSTASIYEADTLKRFYCRCQQAFRYSESEFTSNISSNSSSNDKRAPYRHVTSLEAPHSPYRNNRLSERQTRSVDSNECKTCAQDQHRRAADKEEEEIKAQCKDLWQFRSILERGDTEYEEDEDEDEILNVDNAGLSSCTTSFESNTEPVNIDDFLRVTRPSGPFLEPPRLSLEAKRATLKKLLDNRNIPKRPLVNGISTESYESYETVEGESSESSRPEQILTSFESNQGEQTDSTVDSRRKITLQKDSGYKSQSVEAETQIYHAGVGSSFLPFREPLRRLDQSFDSNTSELSDIMSRPKPEGRRRTTDFFGFSVEEKSDQPSGESFDDPNCKPANSAMYKDDRVNRDFSIDAVSDATFREFAKVDPRMEPRRIQQQQRRFSSYDSGGGRPSRSRLPRFSTKPSFNSEDSVEDEYDNQQRANYRSTRIPIIKLDTDSSELQCAH